MKKYTLTATPRSVLGKKVKSLRAQGQLPATVYGKSVKSISVSVSRDEFISLYENAGETGLIELSVDNDKRPVLVHTMQIDPVTHEPLHIEFHQVDLKEKVHAKVPVEFTGEAPAVEQKLGVLLTVLNDIEVEALPADLPEKIVVDVASLVEVDQEIKVSDIRVPGQVTILADGTLTVVKVGPLVTKEAEAQAAAEAAAAEAASIEMPSEGQATEPVTRAEDKGVAEAKSEEKKAA